MYEILLDVMVLAVITGTFIQYGLRRLNDQTT
jgi:hypothetical protein